MLLPFAPPPPTSFTRLPFHPILRCGANNFRSDNFCFFLIFIRSTPPYLLLLSFIYPHPRLSFFLSRVVLVCFAQSLCALACALAVRHRKRASDRNSRAA